MGYSFQERFPQECSEGYSTEHAASMQVGVTRSAYVV